MGLEEGVGRGTDEFHGKIRVSFLFIKLLPKRDTGSLGISQNTKPALLVGAPKFKPFVKQVLRNAEAFTELLYGAKVCKVLPQKTQNKEQAEAGVRDDDIGKNCVSVLTTITEDSEDAEICFGLLPGIKVNDGTPVVVMDMAIPSAVTDGTGLQFRAELCHKGVKEKIR